MNSKFTTVISIIFMLLCPSIINAQYCTPSGPTTQCDETITNVTLNTINNTSSGCGTTSSGYSDFTTQTTSLNANQAYTISVTLGPSYSGDSVCVWIDYNHNQVFEASELVTIMACYSGTTLTCTSSFTVPFTALSGNTRMRVKVNYFGTGSKDPCVDGAYGEAEDYTVNIVYPYCNPSAATSCAETITNVTLNTINNTSSGCGTSFQGYSPFLGLSTTLNIGQAYTISATVSPVYSGDTVFVWIDYNHNFTFDASERVAVLSCYGSAGTCSGTFTLPGTALTGNTRMRVKLSFVASGNNNPCVDGTFGEAEDYTVNIAPSTNACSGQPLSPLISTTSPVNVCTGNTTTIVATDPNLSTGILYQWQQSSSASGPWTNIAGATSLSYTTPALSSTTYYRLMDSCTISNLTNTSTVFTVNVPTAISIISQPINVNICDGTSALFSVGALGSGLSYQWQVNSGSGFSNVTNSATYSGATTNTLNLITPGTGMSGFMYRCVITNACYTQTTLVDTLQVNAVPTVPVIAPASPVNLCAGDNVTLYTPAMTGITYQWQMNGFDIIGANYPSYTTGASGTYKLLVSSGNNCNNASATVTVVVHTPPTALSISPVGPITFCWGSSVLLSSSALSGITYQWYDNNNLIIGANSDSYNAPDSGTYTLTITDGYGCSAASEGVRLNADILNPSITYNAGTLCTGTFTGYQWYLNGSAISGATSSCYTPVQNGTYYVVVSDTMPCFMPSAPYLIGNLGVSGLSGSNISIKMYPNPATSVLHIDAGIKLKTVISNIEGKTVLTSNDVNIDISRLTSGVYMVQFFDEHDNTLSTERLVKFEQ